MKFRLYLGMLIVITLPLVLSAQSPVLKTKPGEPINIVFGDMKSEKPSLLKLADFLKSGVETSNTLSYATKYVEMTKIAKRVGAANLSVQESDLFLFVNEPTDEAMLEFRNDKLRSQVRVADKVKEIDSDVAHWKKQKLEQEKLVEEKRQADLKQQAEQDKVDALNRNADAQERAARAQEEFNARLARYY